MAPVCRMAPAAPAAAVAALLLLGGVAPQPAEGRLGAPEESAWAGAEAASAAAAGAAAGRSLAASSASGADHAWKLFGYKFYASTSVYGDTPMTGCGELDTKKLVKGTEYYAVASAQSMQDAYPDLHGGGCKWKCWKADGTPVETCKFKHPQNTITDFKPLDGCQCKQQGSCMCGKAGPGTGTLNGTAPMGCFTCATGRFVSRTPYKLNDTTADKLDSKPIKVVVADVCPYGPNYQWCPARPGETNIVGAENHLDFATVPPVGRDYYNNFFVFTPEPCSPEIIARMRNKSTCPASTWPSA